MLDLKEFKEMALRFAKETKEWGSLDQHKFYTTHEYDGWRETPGNEHGGLDVSWAFHLQEEKILEIAEEEYVNQKLEYLEMEYEDITDEINLIKANGSLSKLYNLNSVFDETFDYFFDNEELRKKYNDWDYENDCILLEKSNNDLLKELDKEDMKSYIEFYENYIEELKYELLDIRRSDEQVL